MDDFIYDDIGFDSGSYGDVSNLFDYDLSSLFNSFSGPDLSAVFDFTGGADDANRVTSYIDQLVGGLANPNNDEELAAAINQFTGGDADAARITDYIDTLTEQQVLNNIIGDTGLTFDEALNVGGYKGNIPVGGSEEAIKNAANIMAGGGGNGNGTDTKTIKDTITKILGGGSTQGMDWAKIMALLAGLMSLKKGGGGVSPVGYTGKSTPLTASRQALTPGGEPGAGGKRFMTDVTYAAEGGLMDIVDGQPNQNVTFMAGGGLADYMKMGRGMNVGDLRRADYLVRTGMAPDDAALYYGQVPEGMAKGGISDLGGYSDGGRMLKGPGDGMSDSIPATIAGKRPARLANDEFVVPADVVSHLGNGSSDAGADVLYDMMAKVRKARTGNPKQGKQINPNKYVPA